MPLPAKYDEETGEITYYQPILNNETGEKEFEATLETPQKKPTFKIPTSYINNKELSKIRINILPSDSLSNSGATAILFLLPTSVLFYPFFSLIIAITEVFLHVWAHKKNKLLKSNLLYYQSPLHVISKEFCACCREENYKTKISQFYDKRNDKFRKYGFEYVRRIVT